jgi:hypothetical protein
MAGPLLPFLLFVIQCTAGAASNSANWNNQMIVATHYWDCNGNGCDAATLQPWDPSRYVASAQYAPLDPNDFPGGAMYGEKLWMTGAMSDTLSDDWLGAADGCCGSGGENGNGCGKCVLVRNAESDNPDWTAVVMKKNRCPPWATGCEGDNLHIDMAVPGFDNLQYSTANICGNVAGNTTPHAGSCPPGNQACEDATVCGAWWADGASSIATGCSCASMSDRTPGESLMKKGCELFSAWGWHSGNPSGVEFQVVECPSEFKAFIASAFAEDGVQAFAGIPTADESSGTDDSAGSDSGNSVGGSTDDVFVSDEDCTDQGYCNGRGIALVPSHVRNTSGVCFCECEKGFTGQKCDSLDDSGSASAAVAAAPQLGALLIGLAAAAAR